MGPAVAVGEVAAREGPAVLAAVRPARVVPVGLGVVARRETRRASRSSR